MRDFVIVTDSDTEIPYTFAEQMCIPVFLMPYTVDGALSVVFMGKAMEA